MEFESIEEYISKLSTKDFENLVYNNNFLQFREEFAGSLRKKERTNFDKQVYNQSVFNNIIFDEIIKRVRTNFYHESTPNSFVGRDCFPYFDKYNPNTIKKYISFLTNKNNTFTNKQIQVFVETYINVLYKRLNHVQTINEEREIFGNPVYIFDKMNGIRLEDAENLFYMAASCKGINTERIQKALLDMKLHHCETDVNYDKDKMLYQIVLYRFLREVDGADINKFTRKIYYENNKYPLQVAVKLGYYTLELDLNLKERFKQIVKKEDFASYLKIEKELTKKQQKQQKKIERQDDIAKAIKKLPFSKQTLLKKEKTAQEIIQVKE
ncbi:MAG: hypothetical protein PHQ62_04295 [Clostridia bacterium]|nr:hypothetical protein [Clostridia bacterium]